MPLVAIITDTHFGARKGSKHLHDYFEKFYKNVFFPTLEKYNVKTVIHMGDVFDSRKSIDYQSLEWSKRVVFDPLKDYNVHMITGNHDCYYKNSNKLNSPGQLLSSYPNIKIYSEVKEVFIDKLKVLFIPWINAENFDDTIKHIKVSTCNCAMGHLELNGFRAYPGHTMEDAMDGKLFEKYTKVFSGHYHTRSNDRRIYYLGNPYQMFWSDVNDPRGFTLFDTDTLEHRSINNPYELFHIINYNNQTESDLDLELYEGKIVKVVVCKKENLKEYEKFIDKLSLVCEELKIVESFQLLESDNFDVLDSEDTLSILNNYIEESDINVKKSTIQRIVKDIYEEAHEIV